MSEQSDFRARLVQLGFVAAGGGTWYWVTTYGGLNPLFLPPIDAVARSLATLVGTSTFWAAVQTTLTTMAKAFGIALVLGLLVGYLVTRTRFLMDVFEPLLAGLFSIPKTPFFPLLILLLGIGPNSKVAFGAIYAFFPIALNTIAGLSGVDQRYVTAARSMGATRVGMARHVLLPASLPVIVTGLRIGFFMCFAAVLAGETLASAAGIGHNIARSSEAMNSPRMYAWIAFVVVVAVCLNVAITFIERRYQRGGRA